MTIEEYLAALEPHVPRIRRRRFLREAEGHLRDAAAEHRARGLRARDAEHAAIADFGPAGLVARRLSAEVAVGETRVAAILALAATIFFVIPLYVIPENTLPPAQWETKPRDILVLQAATLAPWLGAVALATVSSVLAWTRHRHLASVSMIAASGAIAVSVLVSGALVVRWFDEVPATPSWPLVAAPLATLCLAACAAAAAWARRRRALLGRGLVQD